MMPVYEYWNFPPQIVGQLHQGRYCLYAKTQGIENCQIDKISTKTCMFDDDEFL